MLPKSLYFLPAWQKNKRNPHHFWVNQVQYSGIFYCPSRCGHNAVCVNDDLIIWGGYSEPEIGNSQYSEKQELWVYNMDNDLWFSVRTEGPCPQYRSGAVGVVNFPYWYLISGHTYLGDTNDVYRLNLLTLQWEEISTSAGLSRRDKASGWCWNDRIYIFGGYGSKPERSESWVDNDSFIIEHGSYRGWISQLLYLDLKTDNWIRPNVQGRQPVPRAAHSSTLVKNKVYIFGGRHQSQRLNDLHCLDLETEKWSGSIECLGQPPDGRSWHTMSKNGDQHLLLYGGFNNQCVPLDDVWLLNISTHTWQELTKHSGCPRLWHTASVNSHGDVLVFGGCTSNILNNDIAMETSNKVVVLKPTPFSLQRMCLHSLFNSRKQTQHLWDNLPFNCREWLNNRCQFYMDMNPDFYENTAVSGFSPSLSELSVMSLEEATRLNDLRIEVD